MHIGSRDVAEFWDPASNVVAVWIELQPLQYRVEDAEVRCRVDATPRYPLPTVLVAGEVAVVQGPHEMTCPVCPLDVKVLNKETGHDHPHSVVHPAARSQLPHRGVHDWVPSPSVAPGDEVFARLVVLHLGKL